MAIGEDDFRNMSRDMRELLAFLHKEAETKGGRMTDVIYKPTRIMIDQQKKECDEACEKRISGETAKSMAQIDRILKDVSLLKAGIYMEMEKTGKDEASKTREQFVMPLQERIKRTEEALFDEEKGDLDDRVVVLERWLDEEKKNRVDKVEESRFSKTWILAIVGFLVSSGIGAAGIVTALLK
jgi:hypothetical protein